MNTRRIIGLEDFKVWDGVSRTFDSVTADGQVLTLHKVGNEVDVCAAYGQGTITTQAVLQAAITAVGTSNKRVFVLTPGTWPITSDLTIPANISLKVPSGTLLAIANTKTLTINGGFEAGLHQTISCTGTGKVVFPQPNGVRYLLPQWWGAKGDGTTDDIIPLQAMVDCSVDSGGILMYLVGGNYKITDTWKLNKGVEYAGFTVRGQGSSKVSATSTNIDATTFGDRPAINIQGARGIDLEDMVIRGKNAAPTAASAAMDPVKANYITAGCNDSRYAPYAGISIDAYYGAAPATAYPNDPYSRAKTSSGVVFRNVHVEGFVVGLLLAPWSATDQDCAAVSAYDCELRINTYGYSCGSGQARSISFFNTVVQQNWVCIATTYHGSQIGNCPSIYNGILQYAHKIFEIGSSNGNNAKTINGVHCEGFGYLGDFGLADSSSSEPTTFIGCHLSWRSIDYEPYFFTANQPMNFTGCFIGYAERSRNTLNFYNPSHYTRFTSTMFAGFVDTPHAFIGLNDGDYVSIKYKFESCDLEYAGNNDSGLFKNINNEHISTSYYQDRQLIAYWTRLVSLYTAVTGYTNYKVLCPFTLGLSGACAASSVVVTGTNHTAVLTFTATTPADFVVGDILMWQVPNRSGTLTTLLIPAFKVTVNAAGAVTATALVDLVDVTYAPATIKIAVPCFFNSVESTGDTHTNTTVDNVTTVANFKIGDFIGGAGIPVDTRIANIVGTTITLNKAATATAATVALYNCKLTSY